jgi:hypothetical protein
MPDEAIEAIKTGVELMASKNAFHSPRLSRAFNEKIIAPILEKDLAALPERALPVYSLGLSDIAKSPDIKTSYKTGWCYTLNQDDETIAHAQTIIDPNGKHLFAGTNEGPLVEGTYKAIKAVEKQKEVKERIFEVRLLIIPALNVAALWLVDKENNVDFAVPIEPAPASLTPNELIPLEDFLAIVQDKAKSAIESYRKLNL